MKKKHWLFSGPSGLEGSPIFPETFDWCHDMACQIESNKPNSSFFKLQQDSYESGVLEYVLKYATYSFKVWLSIGREILIIQVDGVSILLLTGNVNIDKWNGMTILEGTRVCHRTSSNNLHLTSGYSLRIPEFVSSNSKLPSCCNNRWQIIRTTYYNL